jgi:orotate phosphoribosyltransferase
MSLQYQKERLFQIIKTLSVKTGNFILASGKHSSYYIDCRLTTLDAEGAYLAGHLIYEALKPCHVDAVGGMTLGADPIISSVLYRSMQAGDNGLKGFIVRKASKNHGTGRQIEGHLSPWMRVALVEDVVTTGNSTLQAIEAIHKACPSVQVVKVIAMVDRQAGASALFTQQQIPFESLFQVDALLKG